MTRHPKEHHKIRKTVAKSYTRAIKKQTCCTCKHPIPKGVVAKLAGYTDEELKALPPEAIANSFGCGNPVAFSEIKAGDIVLDLGAGAGIDLLLAARKVGKTGKVIGIDMTDSMIAKAKENIVAAKVDNVEVRKCLIENMSVDDASVDWVISNCVINLSPEKPKVFKEIARVLKHGGRMLVSDIVAEPLPQEIIEHPDLYSSCLSGAISEKDYIAGLSKAGLSDIKICDRLVYDVAQLKEFVVSELSDETTRSEREKLQKHIGHLLGKVWSIKVYARKN